jgi:hypothetical protein
LRLLLTEMFFIVFVGCMRSYAGCRPLRVWFSCVKYITVESRWQIQNALRPPYSKSINKLSDGEILLEIGGPLFCAATHLCARNCSMPKKVLIALPPAMLEQVDYIAQCEHRTRSDLIREALRRYLDNFRRTQGSHLSVSTIETPATVGTTLT